MFPDTATSPPSISLAHYFDDTRVEALIAVYDEKAAGQGQELRGAAEEALKSAWGTAKTAVEGECIVRISSLACFPRLV